MTAMARAVSFAGAVRLTRLSIRSLGFSRTVGLLDRLPRPFAATTADEASAARWANEIEGVSGRPYGGTCLDRAVLLWFLMRQRGLAGIIRIGVAFDDDRLDGHAWVEVNGTVVNDHQEVASRFIPFDEDPVELSFR